MKRLFKYKGVIHNGAILISNMFILNFLFILFSLPIITFGSALNSLYATARSLSMDDFLSVHQNFFYNFKKHFYIGTKTFFINFLIFLSQIALIYLSVLMNIKLLTFAMLFIFSFYLLVMIIFYPMSTLYDGDIKMILNNSLVFVHSNLIISIFVFLVAVIFFIFIPVFIPRLIILHILFGFSGMAYFQIKIIEKTIVQKSK